MNGLLSNNSKLSNWDIADSGSCCLIAIYGVAEVFRTTVPEVTGIARAAPLCSFNNDKASQCVDCESIELYVGSWQRNATVEL
jgi:hypothetical protein